MAEYDNLLAEIANDLAAKGKHDGDVQRTSLLARAEAAVRALQTENTTATQALFDVYMHLGFDTDGETNAQRFAATISRWPQVVVDSAIEFRADSEKDYDELQTENTELREKLFISTRAAQINGEQRDDLKRVVTEALARFQKPVHPYGDKRIPKVAEIEFAKDAYGPDLFDDLTAILSSYPLGEGQTQQGDER